MKRWLGPVLVFIASALLALIIVRHNQIWWWCEVHFGVVNEAGPYYGFWSGFGSDLGEYALLTTFFSQFSLMWKVHTCHGYWWCWRHPLFELAGSPYKVCHKHHPEDQLTAKQALARHKEMIERGKAVGSEAVPAADTT